LRWCSVVVVCLRSNGVVVPLQLVVSYSSMLVQRNLRPRWSFCSSSFQV
jgi:hypothetical protein